MADLQEHHDPGDQPDLPDGAHPQAQGFFLPSESNHLSVGSWPTNTTSVETVGVLMKATRWHS